ncbi:MAG: hypothetical protein ACRDGQ_05915 [Candidatus Limnocylindrales bacterium]
MISSPGSSPNGLNSSPNGPDPRSRPPGCYRSALHRRRLVALALVAVLAGACGSSGPTPAGSGSIGPTPAGSTSPGGSSTFGPSPSAGAGASAAPTPDNDAIFAGIETAVQQIRQLTKTANVARRILTEAQLADLISASFDKSNPPALVAANEQLLKALGLLPLSASLKDLDVQLLSSQVAGLYDPDTKTMDVVSKTGTLGPIEQITYAHEFDHALQDQHFGLAKLGLDDPGNSDQALARLSLPEGDATLLMTQWATRNMTPAQLLQLAQEANDPSQTALLATMPDDLKETLLFPYEQGLGWVSGLQSSGGWAAVDAAYADPPDSTAQILNPAKWAGRGKPISVTIPADLPVKLQASLPAKLGAGWTMPLTDTFGELQFQIWLEQVGKVPAATAEAAAGGWAGDRVALVQDGSTFGVVLISRWDTPAAAAQFAAVAGPTLKLLPSATAMIDPGSTNQVVLFVASDQATLNALAGALGLAG